MKYIYNTLLILGLAIFTISNTQAQCFDDGHSPFQNQGWLSCNTSVGPNPDRGDAHWILYDFGHIYELDSVYFWNHNVWGETGMGMKSILIDYSTDKMDWNTIGPISIEKAPGSWKYTGYQGPSLGNVKARYALITVLTTWSDDTSCAGLGEIKFGVNQIVDVTDIEPTIEWTISPNPARERITIHLAEIDGINNLSLYNSVGQLVQELTVTSKDEVIVPISELRDGIYFVAIRTNKEIMTKSFVKG
jgi:hypothetical protein